MSHSTILTSLFNYKAWANQDIFATVKKLKPDEHKQELHAAIRILNHIYVVDRIFQANLQGLKHSFTATNTAETPSLEALLAAVVETDKWYVGYVAQLVRDELEEVVKFNFVDGDKGQMSREEMLMHVVTHGGYHRGAVGRILAQLSIAPPRDIFTKYLHESEPARRA